MKLETSSMSFLPLYRDESKCTLLVLTDPRDKNRVLAIYLNNSWWLTEDVVKTSDPSREGLMQVQTFQERIVLFVLNCIIFGMLEGSLTHGTVFVPHPKKEHSKIFWRSGEAAAFYTIKKKGNLCDGHTSQCYVLPVLDTMFVQRKFRRCGLGMQMLQDFCQSFPSEDALGLSCPLSAEMEKVCQRFLETYPKERSRLWEVEAPGDWTQRVNIWLKIQLEQTFPKSPPCMCNVYWKICQICWQCEEQVVEWYCKMPESEPGHMNLFPLPLKICLMLTFETFGSPQSHRNSIFSCLYQPPGSKDAISNSRKPGRNQALLPPWMKRDVWWCGRVYELPGAAGVAHLKLRYHQPLHCRSLSQSSKKPLDTFT
ncbi:protein FAM169B-like isoform 3-T5 [Liasis olivaceus]